MNTQKQSIGGEDENMSKVTEQTLDYLKESIDKIAFGSVVITVHNGKITQIDTTDKKRF